MESLRVIDISQTSFCLECTLYFMELVKEVDARKGIFPPVPIYRWPPIPMLIPGTTASGTCTTPTNALAQDLLNAVFTAASKTLDVSGFTVATGVSAISARVHGSRLAVSAANPLVDMSVWMGSTQVGAINSIVMPATTGTVDLDITSMTKAYFGDLSQLKLRLTSNGTYSNGSTVSVDQLLIVATMPMEPVVDNTHEDDHHTFSGWR